MNILVQRFGAALKKTEAANRVDFQKKTKTVWTSEKRNYMAYDAAMTEFDANGILRAFKAQAQR